MKNLKKLFLPLLMALLTSPVFADSIGFTSVHSGFWWWVLAVVIAVFTVIAGAAIIAIVYYVLYKDVIYKPSQFACFFGCLGFAGLIAGFFIFPTVWCGALGALVGVILSLSFLFCSLAESTTAMSWVTCSLVCGLAVAAEVFAAIFLPQSWWLWKYFAVAAIGAGTANVISLVSEKFEESKFFALPVTIFSICDFVAFWIVFGICGMNKPAVILLVLFALSVFFTLSSPLILLIMGKKTIFENNFKIIEDIMIVVKPIMEKQFGNEDFQKKVQDIIQSSIKARPYSYNRYYINNTIKAYDEAFVKALVSAEPFINSLFYDSDFFTNSDFIKKSCYSIPKRLYEIFREKIRNNIKKELTQLMIEYIANGMLDNPDFYKKDSILNHYYSDNRVEILNKINQMKEDRKQKESERRKQEAEFERRQKEEKQRAIDEIQKAQEQKNEERKEEENIKSVDASFKKVSDDIDVIELSVQNKNFDIRLLSQLENHVSALLENKNLLSQKDVAAVERKTKYLELIFTDCKKNPSCTGSASVRMDEILKMLKNICGNL